MGITYGPLPPLLPVMDGLWGLWDAAQGVTKDGADNVSQWNDISGNNRNFTQTTGGDQPLFVADVGADLNNKPAISFVGGASNDWMEIASTAFYSTSEVNPSTVFMVYTDYNNGASQWGRAFASQYDRATAGHPGNPTIALFGVDKSAGSAAFWRNACRNGTQGNIYMGYIGFSNADPTVLGITYHNQWSYAGGIFSSYGVNIINGTETCYPALCQGTGGGNVGASADFFYLNNGKFGTGGDYGMQYKLAEFIIYNTALSNADFHTMNDYLNDKYTIY